MTDPLTTESIPVLPLEALKPGRCKVVEVDDRWVLLVRVGDEVRATQGLCSHVRTPLGPGRLTKDGLIECPMHGALFSPADGAVLKGPAKEGLEVYATEVLDGHVHVVLPPADGDDEHAD